MLDVRLIREDPDGVAARLRTRGGDAWKLVAEVVATDGRRRALETERQELQGERNRRSKEIGAQKKAGGDTSEVEAAVRAIGHRISEVGEEADAADRHQRDLLLSIPNLPHAECPVGEDETANPQIRQWGDKPVFGDGFEPADHVTIGERLGLFSFEDGARLAGSGYVVFRGQGARLQRALIQFLLDIQTREHGYEEIAPPFVVSRDCMVGTTQLPKFEDDMFGLEDGALFLIPTAEVPVTNLCRETILKADELPKKMTAYTPCFRREAGSAGRESKGLIRMHQFDKVELVQVVAPDRSMAALDELTGHAEAVLRALGLHYRVIELCTGDLGFGAAKTYDLEVWAPGHGTYLEVSSCSNFGDYQARRMHLRCKNADGKNVFCHTLNGSGTALPRLYVALLETFQQPDGGVMIPAPLAAYFGADSIPAPGA
ncbi:serine--tRNA ligase [soil metagenome]